jgi:hypothetical protein
MQLHSQHCPRCRFDVTWPANLTESQKGEIGIDARQNTIRWIRKARLELGLSLEQTKGGGYHVTQHRGRCHRCDQPVDGIVSVCGTCRSLNLDW